MPPASLANPKPCFSRVVLSNAFKDLGNRLTVSRAAGEAVRRKTAAGFSVFDFIAPTENVLSDILAFLLDPEGSHGQGALFLQTLTARSCRRDIVSKDRPAIAREALTYAVRNGRRRIDIQVTFPDFVFAIETKKFTGEGWKQIADYCDHLSRVSQNNFCLMFLTRTGEEAKSIERDRAQQLIKDGRLTLYSWETEIPAWLKECEKHCGAPKIRHFLEDFRSFIVSYLSTKQMEGTNEEARC